VRRPINEKIKIFEKEGMNEVKNGGKREGLLQPFFYFPLSF